MKKSTWKNLQYLIQYPKDYLKGQKYPVILFFHGAGSRGQDTSALEANPFFKVSEMHSDLPFIIVAPLCSENTWFDMFETVKEFSKHIISADYADENRVYLIGNSMGGYATWQLAMSMPEYFAAIVPICGGGMYWNAGRLCDLPVWAFHGELDPTVSVEESKKMVEKINLKGGHAKLTLYPDAKHDSWTATYANREVFEWLLSNSLDYKTKTKNTDDFANVKKFG